MNQQGIKGFAPLMPFGLLIESICLECDDRAHAIGRETIVLEVASNLDHEFVLVEEHGVCLLAAAL